MNLFEHLESYLGTTVGGWKNPGGEEWQFSVLCFEGGPVPGTLTHCTLGLSDFTLRYCPDCAESRRFELLFVTQESFGDRYIPALLHDIGTKAISQDRAFVRGEVLNLGSNLFPETDIEALYCTSPMHLPEKFSRVETANGDVCLFMWLLPITRAEANLVKEKGWDVFEDKLVEYQPDVFDMYRTPFF